MNAEQLKERWLQFKDDLKRNWGNFTDQDLQQIGGDYGKFLGKVQERYSDKKSELMRWASHWHQQPAPEAVPVRERDNSR